MGTKGTMTRGVLARRAGISAETVRYYERIGLLEEPARTTSGFRVYRGDDLARLRFIRRAEGLGFSLDDIRELIALRLDEDSDCSYVEARAAERLVDVGDRIRDLVRVRRGLEDLIAACRANPAKESCPILEVLEGGDR